MAKFALRSLIVCLALLHGGSVPGQTPRSVRGVADEAQPIAIGFGEGVTWSDNNLETFLFRGGVTIEQGRFTATMKEAVLWINSDEARRGNSLPVTLYGEGDVRLSGDRDVSAGQKIVLELRTRAEFRLKKRDLTRQNGTDDPLYRRALAERQSLLRPAEPRTPQPVHRTSMPERLDEGVVPAQAVEPLPPGATPLPPLAGGTPGLPGIQPQRFRRVQITPRSSSPFTQETFPAGPDEHVIVITDGVSIYVDDPENAGVIDLSTDRAVIWARGIGDGQRVLSELRSGDNGQLQIEVYLEGHVEIRQSSTSGQMAGITQFITAERAYYDVSRHVAVMSNSEVVTLQPQISVPIYLRAAEVRQVAQNRFEASNADVFASRLPSDPDLVLRTTGAGVEDQIVPVRGLFGRPEFDPLTGQPRTRHRLVGDAENLTIRALDVPIGYFPYAKGDLRDPLGPFERLAVGQSRIMGFQLQTRWDVIELLGSDPIQGTKWYLDLDYLSKRGPALGTAFYSSGRDFFGLDGKYNTEVRIYEIYDNGRDILGGPREFDPPDKFRGREFVRHRQEIGADGLLLFQFSHLSDRNFLESFYKREFDEDPDQETYLYYKQQADNAAFTLLAQPALHDWVNQEFWLPRADLYLLGEGFSGSDSSFLRGLTYNLHASAGYGGLEPTSDVSDAFLNAAYPLEFARNRPLPPSSDYPHHRSIDLGRFDLFQELAYPLDLAPFKVVPYGILDLSYYTETLDEDSVGRIYGGGGIRGSLPFSRVYSDVYSYLFNLNGLAHKMVFDADYRIARSNVDFRTLPLLDRLDDDATDQARRDLRLHRIATAPAASRDYFLATSPFFDPQLYALRRGLETSTETFDDIQYLRFGMRHRLQTKRGFPNQQHIVDWMTFDVHASFFPEADRDNFGHSFGMIDFDYSWHIGDRTTILSSGWFEPYKDGAKVFNLGMFLERPERGSYYLGYRMIDPIGSDAMIASATYNFSSKWAATFATTYDFGISQNLGQSLVLTRYGSDIQVSFGFTYQPLTNNFGVTFDILPVLVPARGSGRTLGLLQGAR